jgi:hypothetical protein
MTSSVQQQLSVNETTISSTAASSSVVIKPGFVSGPSLDTKPDYENIHGPLGKWIDNNLFMTVFRYQLAQKVGVDSAKPLNDYTGLIELTAAMNARYSNRTTAQELAQETLRKEPKLIFHSMQYVWYRRVLSIFDRLTKAFCMSTIWALIYRLSILVSTRTTQKLQHYVC